MKYSSCSFVITAKKNLVGMLFGILYTFVPVYVFAAPQTVQGFYHKDTAGSQTNDITGQTAATSGWITAFQTILALLILVAIIYFGLKLLNRNMSRQRSSLVVQVLAQQPLTTSRSIHLVEIAGQLYVLGVGESVTCLDKITDESTIRNIIEKVNQTQEPVNSFQNLGSWLSPYKKQLATLVRRKRQRFNDPNTDAESIEASNFQEALERQLESLRTVRESLEMDRQISENDHDHQKENRGNG
ncbi:flagellar biosynthetic protein FliO [Fodinisporobacter ferrooxydans]|uniref:Flagellar biosynthetic protein FliO n=1 Tax=Fodinisporobacter ferrooxydans TaxID=2901836 RepID=A0ABY4CQW5_9BACL|nr:flagellar biosynthetic protein FliO [Alicyclobacillaceae bacterium MYW30-H2]